MLGFILLGLIIYGLAKVYEFFGGSFDTGPSKSYAERMDRYGWPNA